MLFLSRQSSADRMEAAGLVFPMFDDLAPGAKKIRAITLPDGQTEQLSRLKRSWLTTR
jgi:hypothetical protein